MILFRRERAFGDGLSWITIVNDDKVDRKRWSGARCRSMIGILDDGLCFVTTVMRSMQRVNPLEILYGRQLVDGIRRWG